MPTESQADGKAGKILFVFPRWPEHSLWGQFRYKFPALGLLTIAAVTPAQYEIAYIDENTQELDPSTDADLIALSAMTPLANRSYEIGDYYRSKGKTVVMGGIHVSSNAQEALAHCDAVVIGEGEKSWGQLLEDYSNGRLQRQYRGNSFITMNDLPPPRRDLLAQGAYLTKNTIQFTRGCPFDCEYCSVTAFFGRAFRSNSVEHFAREFAALQGKFAFIVDDNIASNRTMTLQLLDGIRDTGKWWASQAPITVADDDELLRKMAASGCKALFIGFESLRQENLLKMGKGFVRASKHAERIKKILDTGIGIQGSFIIGYDFDDDSTFDQLYEFIIGSRMNAFLISVLTPFPGTKLTERLEKENRIISRNWSRYDMNTVVFKPIKFTPDILQAKYDELNRALYSIPSILKRTAKPRTNMILFVPQNFGFRQAWFKLTENKKGKPAP